MLAFDKFYSSYLLEHQNAQCQLCHATGTSIVILFLMYDARLLFGAAVALILGLCWRCVSDNGFTESILMLLSFLIVISTLGVNLKTGSMLFVILYSFELTGHLFFEFNQLSDLSQPSLSLLSDFRLWYKVLIEEFFHCQTRPYFLFSTFAILYLSWKFHSWMDSRVYDSDGKLMPGPRSNLYGENFNSVLVVARRSKQASKAIKDILIKRVGDGNMCCARLLNGLKIVIVVHPEMAKTVVTGHFMKFPKSSVYKRLKFILGDGLVISSGGTWKAHRQMINPAFHSEALKAMISVFNLHCTELLGRWFKLTDGLKCSNHFKADLNSELSNLTLSIICHAGFGYNYIVEQEKAAGNCYRNDLNSLLDEVNQRILDPFLWWNMFFPERKRKTQRALASWTKLLDRIVSKRIESFQKGNIPDLQDLLDIMLQESQGSEAKLTKAEFRDHCMTFLMAGHETTSTTLLWIFFELSKNQEILELCHQEIDYVYKSNESCKYVDYEDLSKFSYINQVVKEALRLHPPIPIFARQTVEGCQLGQYKVPAGAIVSINLLALHQHPDFWENPDSFIPDRFNEKNIKTTIKHPFQFIPFSAGPRNCIGQRFAQMEIIVILVRILSVFTLEPMYPEDEKNISFEETATYQPKNMRLHLRRRFV